MTPGTPALGSRQDPGRPARRRRILAFAATRVAAVEEDVMADLAYSLLLVGGFAVLALTLRGLQRL
jgi:hypothetical protein